MPNSDFDPGQRSVVEPIQGRVFQQMNPHYYSIIEHVDPPNLLEYVPWFASDESERESA
jgi:hypothetical protein